VFMGKRAGNTNTGGVGKSKKFRTTSNDAGGKSVSEKSKSTGGKCVSENSTVGNLVRHGQVATPSRRQVVRSRNTSLM
jgi:hypothetical protein